MPGPAKPYQPGGPSPNPGGRPKDTPEMKAAKVAARARSPEMIAVLVDVALDTGAKPGERVAAANSVLDRAFGRPEQAIALDVEHKGDPATPELVRAELMRLLAPLAPKVVESTAEEVVALQPKVPQP